MQKIAKNSFNLVTALNNPLAMMDCDTNIHCEMMDHYNNTFVLTFDTPFLC